MTEIRFDFIEDMDIFDIILEYNRLVWIVYGYPFGIYGHYEMDYDEVMEIFQSKRED